MNEPGRKQRLLAELRSQGIRDERVLAAIEAVPRERFVEPTFAAQAWDNIALPIQRGQTISQPYVVAFMTEALEVRETMRVMEVGTGSGYQAAVLSRLCRRVYTMERHRPLLRGAEARFADLGYRNITTRFADGSRGWPEAAPFHRILVTAAAAELQEDLCAQLHDGGVLVIPVGPRGAQQVVRLRREGDSIRREDLLPVRFVPLLDGLAPD